MDVVAGSNPAGLIVSVVRLRSKKSCLIRNTLSACPAMSRCDWRVVGGLRLWVNNSGSITIVEALSLQPDRARSSVPGSPTPDSPHPVRVHVGNVDAFGLFGELGTARTMPPSFANTCRYARHWRACGVRALFASVSGWRTQSRASPRATDSKAFGLKSACSRHCNGAAVVHRRVLAAASDHQLKCKS